MNPYESFFKWLHPTPVCLQPGGAHEWDTARATIREEMIWRPGESSPHHHYVRFRCKHCGRTFRQYMNDSIVQPKRD